MDTVFKVVLYTEYGPDKINREGIEKVMEWAINKACSFLEAENISVTYKVETVSRLSP